MVVVVGIQRTGILVANMKPWELCQKLTQLNHSINTIQLFAVQIYLSSMPSFKYLAQWIPSTMFMVLHTTLLTECKCDLNKL